MSSNCSEKRSSDIKCLFSNFKQDEKQFIESFHEMKVCVENYYGDIYLPTSVFFYLQFVESFDPVHLSVTRQESFTKALEECNASPEITTLFKNVTYDPIQEVHEYSQHWYLSNLAERFELDQTDLKVIVSRVEFYDAHLLIEMSMSHLLLICPSL